MADRASNLRQLGFGASLPVPIPLPADYLQAARPGLQVIGGPFVGDAAVGGRLRVTFLAVYSAPDLPEGTVDYGEPVGPGATVDMGTRGPVHWAFGDGTTGTSGYHEFGASDVAPTTFTHDFGVGTHQVLLRVTAADGQVATATVRVVVYPPLLLRVRRTGDRVGVDISGGDGHLLASRWVFSDGVVRFGHSATVPATARRVAVHVTDGTGTVSGLVLTL